MLSSLRGRFGGRSSRWLGNWNAIPWCLSCVFMKRKEWSLFWREGLKSGEVEIFIVKFSKSTLIICSSFLSCFSKIFRFSVCSYALYVRLWKHNWNECKRFSKLIKFEVIFFFFSRILFWLDPWCEEVILKGTLFGTISNCPK